MRAAAKLRRNDLYGGMQRKSAPALTWHRAKGSTVWSGRRVSEHVDFTSGVVLANLGHAHADVCKAIQKTISRSLLHAYNNPFREKQLLEETLSRLVPHLSNVHFCVSGSDAIEQALKMAFRARGSRGKCVISFRHAFHGKTFGAGAVSDIERYKLSPIHDGVGWVKTFTFPGHSRCLDALRYIESASSRIAAVLIEPIQGSTLSMLDPSIGRALTKVCRQQGIPLISDEIQVGCYRFGKFSISRDFGLSPDMTCFGKGLTCSLPLSAVLYGNRYRHTVRDWDGTTHSCNPVCAAAALGALRAYARVNFKSAYLRSRTAFFGFLSELERMLSESSVRLIRTTGHLAALDFTNARSEPGAFVDQCRRRGILLPRPIGPNSSLVKLAPPVIITKKTLTLALDAMAPLLRKL